MTAYRPSPKLLEVLAYLREREIAGWAEGYTLSVGVATNTDTMRAARTGATPSVRAARHSGVDE